MNRHYVLAKYTDDLARNEPINIGLIVYDAERAIAKFRGEREPGHVDLRLVGRRVGGRRTFKSWVEYWQKALNDPQRLDMTKDRPADVVAALIASSKGNFTLAPGGSILVDVTTDSLEEVLDSLYARLVEAREVATVPDDRSPRRRQGIGRRSLAVIRQAGVPLDNPDRFRRNVGVRVTIGDIEDEEEVSYAVMNGAWHYLQEVAFDPADVKGTRREAHHAALLVEASHIAREAAFLYEGDRVSPATAHLVEILRAIAPTIDVADEGTAAERLRTQLRLV